VPLFKRNKPDDKPNTEPKQQPDEGPVDMEARSPEIGLKWKDIEILGKMVKQGANLKEPRHAVYYLYFGSRENALEAVAGGGAAGYSCEARDPLPGYPGQWSVVCERPDAVLDVAGARRADDLFQELADRLAGEFDGWEASMQPSGSA
jgi:hypothetical protein